jgi:mRNA degradation ribonuclease J1/J2
MIFSPSAVSLKTPNTAIVLAGNRRFDFTKVRQHLGAEQLNGTQDLPLG